jgi:YVTN family beta-propeller protein
MSASDRRSFLKTMRTLSRWIIRVSLIVGLVFGVILVGAAQVKPQSSKPDRDDDAAENRRELLPTGQFITPLAPPGAVQQFLNPGLANYPDFVANEAVRSQLSPDGSTLLVLCAGYNTNVALAADGLNAFVDVPASTQYIFVFDVKGSHRSKPALRQVIHQRNAYVGLVWAPSGKTFYATGGNDDAVYAYSQSGGSWVQSAKIALGHPFGAGLNLPGVFSTEPNAAGLGISADGRTLVVANNYNDSISVIDTATNTVRFEHDLRPYFLDNEVTDGVAGGEFPHAVVVKGNGTAYVSANRDREVVVVDISGGTFGKLIARIPVHGLPNGMALNAAQTTLYVAEDNSDEVAVIDTASNTVTDTIDTRAPAGMLTGPRYTGAAPFAVTVSPDQKTLYAVNDGANSIAVIPLTGSRANTVTGLIPTAYGPKDVTLSADGRYMYIISGKSDQGPNPLNLFFDTDKLTTITYPGGNQAAAAAAAAANQYQLNNNRSTLVTARVPDGDDLEELTAEVARNNFYTVQPDEHDQKVMAFLRSKIHHVIYIVKENRTFDQVLGDLDNGADGDASLAVFGKKITPSYHRLANSFVTLDQFLDTGDASMDGWGWSLQGRATSTLSLTQNINYAGVDRGLSYLSEGTNRDIPTGLTVPQRLAIFGSLYSAALAGQPGGVNNVLPGTADVAASDAPFGKGKGYIFDAVLAAGGTLRNYGFLTFNVGPLIDNPGAVGAQQVVPLQKTMLQPGITDPFFRGFDQAYPDLWRYHEWKREFDQYVANGNLPTMQTVRFNHDHTGSYGSAVAGVNTPETQQADCDFATGKLIEDIAHSRYASDTLIFIIEDDSQDGPDHVDSHRTTAYVVGPYVRKHAVVSKHYSTVSMLRTIEDVLGLQHLNLNTAYQRPMTEVFDAHSDGRWDFRAVASQILKTTTLDLTGVQFAAGGAVRPAHPASWWAEQTKGFDWSAEDRAPAELFNRILWRGLKGKAPYPVAPGRHGVRDN